MDRSREARRTTAMAFSNGLSRRRHRTNLRDSPDEDGSVELPDVRLRDRSGSAKKERDRDRDRDRGKDRLNQSKRRRADMHGSNREDDDGQSSDESLNHEDDEEDDGGGGGSASNGHFRVLPPSSVSASSSLSSSLLNHSSRRSFPLATTTATTKMFKPVAPWNAADEMIGVPVPRKARSASTKRSHEWLFSSGHVATGSAAEQIFRQASTSPVTTMMASPVRPASPSSSNASARKKMKGNGSKPRLHKSLSKSSSSDQDEIEIEIAEVLYGMMRQPQVPSPNHEGTLADSIRFKNREERRFSGDTKSQISSPISNSPAAAPQLSSSLPQNSSSSVTLPISAIAPKRRKPRPIKYDDENHLTQPVRGSLSSTLGKAGADKTAKVEAESPDLDNLQGSTVAAENGGTLCDLAAEQTQETELVKPENTVVLPDSEACEDTESGNREPGVAKDERQPSPKKESFDLQSDDDCANNMITSKANEIESQRDQKFQIDLMALPSRSSPEVDVELNIKAQDPETGEAKSPNKDGVNAMNLGGGEQGTNAGYRDLKESLKSHKQVLYKENNDMQFDMEKQTDNGTSGGTTNIKHNHVVPKQQQILSEKIVQPSNSLTFPMSLAGWPGGLPPMGYMTPLQGVVPMDGSVVSPASMQPRPKKCATHCYIARNIHYHQQFMRMGLFWPPAAGSASLYGAKPGTINAVPPTDFPARSGTAVPEKAPNLGLFPGMENSTTTAANSLDPSQRKQQMVLQHTLPPGAHNNIMQGPAFIFPLSQQHAAAATSIRPAAGTVKALNPGAVSTSTNALSSASTAVAAASAMSFSYSSMPGGEPQYLAILQNNGFPFPVPTHVGAAPTYHNTHAQVMPFFNGPFYSSQMFHPSQLQQQTPVPTLQAAQSGHQNSVLSSGSTSSQKHLQTQQHQKQTQSSIGNGSLQSFPSATKVQHSQQQNHHNTSHTPGLLDRETNIEDAPLSTDARVSNVNIYGQNFSLPIFPPNFTLMSPMQMTGGPNTASGMVTSEKKQQQQQQPQLLGPKATGFDSLHSQAFAMSFGSLNSSTSASSADISSITPNHSILQSLPEGNRHNYQIFAAAANAQSTQQKKNYRASDEGKNGSSKTIFEERKTKGSINMGQSIAFSRQDLTAEATVSSLPGSSVVDSSARTLNVASGRSSGSAMPAVVNNINNPQWNQHQQPIMQLQKQRQFAAAAAAARSKSTVSGNVGVSMEQQVPPFSSTTAAAAAGKSSNVLSPFQQNIVQNISNSSQPPQWKNSPRSAPGVSQIPSSLNSTFSALKSYHQPQQGQPLQGQTQISFAAANSKGSNPHQVVVQQLPSSSQAPSPPMRVGSPTTSSISKSAGGSPRTTSSVTSTGNKTNQASILSTPPAKNNSPSVGGLKSPAVPGAAPSILGNSPVINSSGGTMKHQHPQQLPKQQHAQLFFTHPYVQVQPPHSTSSAASLPSSYYSGNRNTDPKTLQQQPQSMPSTSPISLVNSSTCDPVKAVAASNLKGGGSQGILHAAQFASVVQTSVSPHQIVSGGFPYIHTAQNTPPVKAAEQKQPSAAREESRRSDT
ncbi:hypothetical protein SAY87_023671 [Trapa incisa]|uniref:Protein TIME FOR COFFEE n=1 Tax=Trapa incisa TaxID=236973 RepID=A0AAN7KZ77_9MYRT|nr:hypothetical protein SAY87_023671 [Trapa incisa]